MPKYSSEIVIIIRIDLFKKQYKSQEIGKNAGDANADWDNIPKMITIINDS